MGKEHFEQMIEPGFENSPVHGYTYFDEHYASLNSMQTNREKSAHFSQNKEIEGAPFVLRSLEGLLDKRINDFAEFVQEHPGQIIDNFRDEHYFLSSMYPLPNGVMTPSGAIVPSVEIGYQAAKFVDPEARDKVLGSVDGYESKRRANKLIKEEHAEVKEDWADNKLHVMHWFVLQKFHRNPELAQKLLATDGQEIIEKNNWGDRYWGISKAKGGAVSGENMLGKLLMHTRDLLEADEDLGEHAEVLARNVPFLREMLGEQADADELDEQLKLFEE